MYEAGGLGHHHVTSSSPKYKLLQACTTAYRIRLNVPSVFNTSISLSLQMSPNISLVNLSSAYASLPFSPHIFSPTSLYIRVHLRIFLSVSSRLPLLLLHLYYRPPTIPPSAISTSLSLSLAMLLRTNWLSDYPGITYTVVICVANHRWPLTRPTADHWPIDHSLHPCVHFRMYIEYGELLSVYLYLSAMQSAIPSSPLIVSNVPCSELRNYK